MSESTLTAAFTDLQGDVGFYLGWGRTYSALDANQQASVDRCVKGGMRRFYFSGDKWSFLQPEATLTATVNQATVALPDDFGGVEGRLSVTLSGGMTWGPLDFRPMGDVYQAYAVHPQTTGRPQLVCAEPIKGTTLTASSRSQLRLWPLPDAAYVLNFRYYLDPDYLTGAFPYAYGGPEHSETLLEACLVVAEKILDDAAAVHEQAYQERLAASRELDRRKKPQHFGYNRDLSDQRHRAGRASQHGETLVRINGVLYA